jgi:hypothetical protein
VSGDIDKPSAMSLDEMVDLALAMARHEAETMLKLKRDQLQKKPDPSSKPE